MFTARTKLDLIIEVWEKLDCESVGAEEIEAIAVVVRDKFGQQAVDSPMIIARELADEGAELRHAEILKLDVQRRLESPYDAMFRNILKFNDFNQALRSIAQVENLRQKFLSESDNEGLRLVKEILIKSKKRTLLISQNPKVDAKKRSKKAEIAEWITLYLQSPEIFETWVEARQNSEDFKNAFPTA